MDLFSVSICDIITLGTMLGISSFVLASPSFVQLAIPIVHPYEEAQGFSVS